MTAALVVIGYAYVLWVLFLAVMALHNVWDDLPPFTKLLAFPAAFLAVVLDIGFNLAASVVFLDRPREVTFSQRMGRYKREGGRRAVVARWICSNLLDPFQVGGHCH